ncbi:MAG TPA: Mpo1-like protein [Candidatus Baltobacteraceae bacterium]|nr:Mpo1-like protein [Candidatus Baltobacteraceae bacterium]
MTKDQLYADYAGYHQDVRNRRAHAAGIPLIVLGLLGLFHACPLLRIGPVDLAVVAAVAVLLYYVALDVRGALISAVAFFVLYEIAIHLTWELCVGAFILGWIFQLVGHRFEGNKPKFLENVVYLLVGPLYFFQELFDSLILTKRAT